MSNQKNLTEGTPSTGLHERASGLNEIGAHYFVGWLISAGFQRREVMAEIERIMGDMEINPELRHCWMKEDATAVPAGAATEAFAQPEPEPQPAAGENVPRLVADLPAPPNPLSSPVKLEPKPVRHSRFPSRILDVLFGRPSVAA